MGSFARHNGFKHRSKGASLGRVGGGEDRGFAFGDQGVQAEIVGIMQAEIEGCRRKSWGAGGSAGGNRGVQAEMQAEIVDGRRKFWELSINCLRANSWADAQILFLWK